MTKAESDEKQQEDIDTSKDLLDASHNLSSLIEALGDSVDGEQSNFVSDLKGRSETAEELANRENANILAMRNRWSNWVLIFIGLIIGFDITLVSLYGMGVWDFKDPRVVMVVITDNFLKIVGLGLLITQKIFSWKRDNNK